MKRCLPALALLLLILVACNKDKDNTPQNNDPDLPPGTISYKYNDSLQVIHDGDDLAPYHFGFASTVVNKVPAQANYNTNYYLSGNGADEVYSKYVGLVIYTDSLKPGTYKSSSQNQVMLNVRFKDVVSIQSNPGDYSEVTITSHHDGVVSGTFKGHVSELHQLGDFPAPAIANITEGKFRDIPVKY